MSNEHKEWKGNSEAFRSYFHGKTDSKGKSIPAEKIKDHPGHLWEEVCEDENFGAVLNDGYIDVSFDSADFSEGFWRMSDKNQWECLILENPKNGNIHSIWKKPANWKAKDGTDVMSAVGLVADIHSGSTYIRLRDNGEDRFPPLYEPERIQELPEELYPVKTTYKPFGMSEGEARNNTLSGMTKNLIHNTKFSREQIERIMSNTNEFVFNESLQDSELNAILRDETFADMPERKLEVINARDLFYKDVTPTEFIINGLIPVGLTVLASPPKFGKSWMVLDMGISVASGTEFLRFPVKQCRVLYLDLEDREDRLKERMLKITGEKPFPEKFEIVLESPTLDNGLLEYLEKYLQYSEARLIIVDTLAKIRGIPSGREAPYGVDSRELGTLKKFADRQNIAMLLVTHTRKFVDPSDPFANITGTFGITGIADDMIVLSKEKREDALTKMSVTGRDITYEDYAISFNPERGKWERVEESWEWIEAQAQETRRYIEYHSSNIGETINKILDETDGTWQGRCNEIIQKSHDYGTVISLTSQKLGKKLHDIKRFLYQDGISYTEISKGSASKVYKFERLNT